MKAFKCTGIAWGMIYFAVGIISSFTINSIDFWSSITLLVFTFLLPLPITVVAFWFSKSAGIALIISAVLCVAILVYLSGVKDTMTASPGVKFYIPHLIFALAYIIAGRVSKDVGSGGEKSSVGTA